MFRMTKLVDLENFFDSVCSRFCKKGFECYKIGTDLGDANAKACLAACYLNGDGIGKDTAKGFLLALEAAEMGNTQAMINVGLCYYHGEGVRKNTSKAKEWIQKAIDLGDAAAKEYLKNMD